MKLHQKVAMKIQEARKELGYSAEYVANKLNIAASTYSNWENGNTELSISKIEQIAEFFNKPISYFLDIQATVVQINHGEHGSNIKNQHNHADKETMQLIAKSIQLLSEYFNALEKK
jgi:transcriptional regulator with XRE-family HTH domain